MARPENAPASSFSWKARAVPMPCEVVPSEKPRTAGSVTRSAFSTKGPSTAPRMPVETTRILGAVLGVSTGILGAVLGPFVLNAQDAGRNHQDRGERGRAAEL